MQLSSSKGEVYDGRARGELYVLWEESIEVQLAGSAIRGMLDLESRDWGKQWRFEAVQGAFGIDRGEVAG